MYTMKRVFRGKTIGVREWSCSGHDTPGSAESSPAYGIAVVRSGMFFWRSGSRSTLIRPGTAVFIVPDEEYSVTHHRGFGDAGYYIGLSPQGTRDLLSSCDPGAALTTSPKFPVRKLAISAPSYLRQRTAVAAAAKGDFLAAEEGLLTFLSDIVSDTYARHGVLDRGIARALANRRKAREQTAHVLEIVASRYCEPLSLEGIAREVGCSPFHLSRIVTAVAGQSVHQLVIGYRLRAAAERILDGERNLARIGLAVGFSSHSHFTDAFRRVFNCVPSDLRRQAGRASRRSGPNLHVS